MGLFRNEKKDLEEALQGLLSNIGANYMFHEGVAATSSVQSRVAKVNEVATRMKQKGKTADLEDVVDAWIGKRPETGVLFRGSTDGIEAALDRQEAMWADVGRDLPPITGSGPKAEEEEARRTEIAKMAAAQDYWRSVLNGLR